MQVHPDLQTFVEHPLPRIMSAVEAVMASRRERVTRGELKALTPDEVAAVPPHAETADQLALAAARDRSILAYLRSALELVDTPSYPTLDAADETTKRFDDWSRNKTHRFYALINYITGTLGLPPDLARLEIARALAGEDSSLIICASAKRRSPPERMEQLRERVRTVIDAMMANMA